MTLEDIARHRIIRQLIGMEVTDLIQATDDRLRDGGVKSVEDVQRLSYNVIGFSEDMHRRNPELKDYLYTKLYHHHRVVRMQAKAERILNDLFNVYYIEPNILPDHIQEIIDKRGLPGTICDYIAGMTDRYAIEEHQKLFNPLEKP